MKLSKKAVFVIGWCLNVVLQTVAIVHAAPPELVIPAEIDFSQSVAEDTSRETALPKEGKLTQSLVLLFKVYSTHGMKSELTLAASELRKMFGISEDDLNPVVEVGISTNEVISRDRLELVGAKERLRIDNLIFASVPVSSMKELAELTGVQSVRGIVSPDLQHRLASSDAPCEMSVAEF